MWMEYMEDYDFTLHYHPSKAIVVADALNRKSRGVLASVVSESGRCSRLWDSLYCIIVIKLKER